MTKWTNEEHTHYTPAQRSFAADMMNLGPASTMGRELLTVIIQTGVVVLLLFVVSQTVSLSRGAGFCSQQPLSTLPSDSSQASQSGVVAK